MTADSPPTRRRVLTAAGLCGTGALIGGFGISALFRDIDRRPGGVRDPELLDVQVVRSDPGTVDGEPIEEPPLESENQPDSLCSRPESNDTGDSSIELGDIDRGDVQTLTFGFELCETPATLRMVGTLRDTSSVAVLQAIRVAAWVGRTGDDLDSHRLVFRGSLHDMLGSGEGIELRTARSAGDGTEGCFRPDEAYRVVFAWWLPESSEFDPTPGGLAFDLDLSATPCETRR